MFLVEAAYHSSEIMVMNFMYILAKNAWKILEQPVIAGMVFLILGWAFPRSLQRIFL